MTPTPPRGFIALSLGDGGNPLFVRASDIVAVGASVDRVYVAITNDFGYTVDDDLATVLAAIDAAAVVEQNGVAASFMVKMLDQLAKQAKA
jgi:hypothetical protein